VYVNSKVLSCIDEVAGAEPTSKKPAAAATMIRVMELCRAIIEVAFYSLF
jgi:hypothetical protein